MLAQSSAALFLRMNAANTLVCLLWKSQAKILMSNRFQAFGQKMELRFHGEVVDLLKNPSILTESSIVFIMCLKGSVSSGVLFHTLV